MPSISPLMAGSGPNFTPIWKALRSSQNDEKWNPATRSALRSVVANRQWTQERGHKAGWLDHNKCILCLNRLATETEGPQPTAEALLHCVPMAPVGNLSHRGWECPAHGHKRATMAPKAMLDGAARGEHAGNGVFLVGPAKLLFARCRCSNRELAFEPHALTPSLEMSQPTDRARLALICTDRSAIGGSSVIWSRHKKAGPMPSFAMARSSQRRL